MVFSIWQPFRASLLVSFLFKVWCLSQTVTQFSLVKSNHPIQSKWNKLQRFNLPHDLNLEFNIQFEWKRNWTSYVFQSAWNSRLLPECTQPSTREGAPQPPPSPSTGPSRAVERIELKIQVVWMRPVVVFTNRTGLRFEFPIHGHTFISWSP